MQMFVNCCPLCLSWPNSIKLIVLHIKLRMLVCLLPTKAEHKHLGDYLVVMASFMVSHIYGSKLTLIPPLTIYFVYK